jgi:uncharacterized delta-60 repeat protein
MSGTVITPVGLYDDVAHSVTMQPDGKILVAGYTSDGHTDYFALVRYNADGTLDTSFDGDGKVITPVGPFDRDQGHSVTATNRGWRCRICTAGIPGPGVVSV